MTRTPRRVLSRSFPAFLSILLFYLAPPPGSRAQTPDFLPPGSTSPGPSVEDRAAHALREKKTEEAIRLLKADLSVNLSSSLRARLLLAKAYQSQHNDFWALQTLEEASQAFPGDCEPRLWAAWFLLRQGSLDSAEGKLREVPCPPQGPLHAKGWVLMTTIEKLRGDLTLARAHLRMLWNKKRVVFPEDRAALVTLRRALEPGHLPAISGRMETLVGYCTNAWTSSPGESVDPDKIPKSPMAQVLLACRLLGPELRESPSFSRLRTSLEWQGRFFGYSHPDAKDLSYMQNSFRPALLFGDVSPRLLLGYRYEHFLLAGGDRYQSKNVWFYESHRGEMELELSGGFTAFGGAGTRSYREIGRSRVEIDGGLGSSFRILPPLRLLAAIAVRAHDAKKDPYDLQGGTALTSWHLRLRGPWTLRLNASASFDRYFRSAGYFDESKPAQNREDLSLKLGLATPLPLPSRRLTTLVSYEFHQRDSTLPAFDYQDHRVSLRWTVSFEKEKGLPRTVTPPGHIVLQDETSSSNPFERVQELLQQDETMQRGSTCLD